MLYFKIILKRIEERTLKSKIKYKMKENKGENWLVIGVGENFLYIKKVKIEIIRENIWLYGN